MSRNHLNLPPQLSSITQDRTSLAGSGGLTKTWKKPEQSSSLLVLKVEWLDSYTESGWAEYETVDALTTTYGLFVGENDDFLTLAMTKEEGYWGNQWHIPIPNVRSITVISNAIESTEHDN